MTVKLDKTRSKCFQMLEKTLGCDPSENESIAGEVAFFPIFCRGLFYLVPDRSKPEETKGEAFSFMEHMKV